MNLPAGARAIPDPEAEVERLAAERRATEKVLITRRDLDTLLSVAAALLDADAPAVPYADVQDVVRRHGRN